MCIPATEAERMQMIRDYAMTGSMAKGGCSMGAYFPRRDVLPVASMGSSPSPLPVSATFVEGMAQLASLASLASLVVFGAWRGAMGYVVGKKLGSPWAGAIANIFAGLPGMTLVAAASDKKPTPNGRRRRRGRGRRGSWRRR